jgi:hypothetical protein
MKSLAKIFSKMPWVAIAQTKTITMGILALVILCSVQKVSGQSMLDVSVGTSLQDNFFTTAAYRYQVSDKFRIGLEAQFGSTQYRLMQAKAVTRGNASTFSVPLTLRLYEKEQLRLDFYTKVGMRFQSLSEPTAKEVTDSLDKSTAFVFEGGLLVTVKLSEKLNLQSGVTFPVAFQTSPSAIFENVYPGMLHLGFNYKTTEKSTIFAKSLVGGSVGGSGDTQKLGWSLQGGVRFNFGQKTTPTFVEPTF